LVISHTDSQVFLIKNINDHIENRSIIDKIFSDKLGNLEYMDENGKEIFAFLET